MMKIDKLFEFGLEGALLVMLFLIPDVVIYLLNAWFANWIGGISGLPRKFICYQILLVDEMGTAAF